MGHEEALFWMHATLFLKSRKMCFKTLELFSKASVYTHILLFVALMLLQLQHSDPKLWSVAL